MNLFTLIYFGETLNTQVGSKLEDMIPTMKAGRHIKESFKVRGIWAQPPAAHEANT